VKRAASHTDDEIEALEPEDFERWRNQAPARVGEIGTLVAGPDSYTVRVTLEDRTDRAVVATFAFPRLTWDEWWSETGSEVGGTSVEVVAEEGYRLPDIIGRGGAVCDGDFWDNGALDDLPDRRSGHSAVWTGSEMILWGGSHLGNWSTWTGMRYQPATDSWTTMSTINAPPPRYGYKTIWTGEVMILWGGWGTITGGRYDPATDAWTPTSIGVNVPSERFSYSVVWTGEEIIIWGGSSSQWVRLNTGARYDPVANSWLPISTDGAPAGRTGHVAVWTGDQMIVWGGDDGGPPYSSTGGVYDLATDSWTPTSVSNVPTGRVDHTAVWSGSRMIVWGGSDLNTGGRYDPATNSWLPTSIVNAPEPRRLHTAIWSGTEMIVWGGRYYEELASGGRYDPVSDWWSPTATAPVARAGHTAVWAGDEMIVWDWGEGGRYDPTSNSWTPTYSPGAPTRRTLHSAVWTGNEMIVWGGFYTVNKGDAYYDQDVDTGGRYNPTTDSWEPMSTTNAPDRRHAHEAVWSGNVMIVWGGDPESGGQTTNSGGRYDPIADQWTPTSLVGVPQSRAGFTAVWAGDRMVVWGGRTAGGTSLATGGRYNPVGDVWQATSQVGAPAARYNHTALWTGAEMIVWGGRTGSTSSSRINTGGRYDPVGNTWVPTSTQEAPVARGLHTAVWGYNRMFVWGGRDTENDALDTGGIYAPFADLWDPIPTDGAPEPRAFHTAVWSGKQMVVWGGSSDPGGRYDPLDQQWAPTTEDDAPSSRSGHTAIWTGDRMIIWGGSGEATGGSYDADGVDRDGDGYGCALDCDDEAGGVFASPVEVLRVLFGADKVTLEWLSVAPFSGSATVYDVVRGSELPAGSDPSEICFESGYPVGGGTGTIQLEVAEEPGAGVLYWYLVRATNVCGNGTYGLTSLEEERVTEACH
jgi:N-acetylneuraminic acid mutarotase